MFTAGPGFFRAASGASSGPLDAYTTNLWAACWIARLLGAYSGPLIRVRRSSDNAEQNIGFAVGGALDTAVLATFVGGGSAFVTRVYDQSGAANDLVQATTTKQPRIVNAGTYDGFLRFDGTDDCLTSVNPSGTPSGMSAFIKGNLPSTPTQVLLESGSNAGAGHATFLWADIGSPNYSALFETDTTGANTESDFGFPIANNVQGTVIDRTQSTIVTALRLWAAGAELTSIRTAGAGTLPSGNFTAETWNFGARNNGASLPSVLNAFGVVIYEAQKATDAAAITVALA